MDVKGLSSKDTDKYIHKLLSERMIFSDGLIPNFVPIVKAAALQYKGQIFTGPIHAIAYEKLLQKHPEAKLIPSETLKSGFLVKKSKYLHEEFLSRSDTAKLIGQDHSFLQAEDLNLNSGFIPNFNYLFYKRTQNKKISKCLL